METAQAPTPAPKHVSLEAKSPFEMRVHLGDDVPDMEVKGWTVGSSAKQQRFRRNPKARSRDDYWVPPGELLMGELLVQMKRGKG